MEYFLVPLYANYFLDLTIYHLFELFSFRNFHSPFYIIFVWLWILPASGVGVDGVLFFIFAFAESTANYFGAEIAIVKDGPEVAVILLGGIVEQDLKLLPSRLEGGGLAAGELLEGNLSSLVLLV
jgi:hypothetical protein